MDAEEFRAALATLGFSQEGFGEWIGVGKRTSQGYALGETRVPGPTAIMLRLMVKGKITVKDVETARK